jgi:ethanolaminephosphotransferase
MQKLSK